MSLITLVARIDAEQILATLELIIDLLFQLEEGCKMSRLQKPITITAGVPKVITFTIRNEQTGLVENLTGHTGVFEVADKISPTTSVLSVAMVLVVAASGTIKVTLSAANTTTLGIGSFTCQIQLNDGSDDVTVIDQPELSVRGAIA